METCVDRMQSKKCVITGASSGIGLAATKLFAAEGAQIMAIDLDEAALRRTVVPLVNGVTSFVADVTQPEQMERAMATAAERMGGIDVLLPNAGIWGNFCPIVDYPADFFSHVLDVNVTGVFLAMKYAIPHMVLGGGGSIVITSAVGAVLGAPETIAYTASKHALTGIMKVAARELAPFGIRVNTVNPGLVKTPMGETVTSQASSTAAGGSGNGILEGNLIKRYCTPEEVAQLMLYLASDAGTFCTGAMYFIDGGMQYA
jgi:NAD(P)-dependent dehydrogenase (short-subunit alcohol dehydrogenase family)